VKNFIVLKKASSPVFLKSNHKRRTFSAFSQHDEILAFLKV